jgi:hypothetical protein
MAIKKENAFREVIKFGEEYTAKRSLPSGNIWLNLACAYGRRMSWLKANPSKQTTSVLTNSQEQSQTWNQAIKAVNESLLLDPMSKTKFQELLQGTDGKENDLVAFKDDQTFRSATRL